MEINLTEAFHWSTVSSLILAEQWGFCRQGNPQGLSCVSLSFIEMLTQLLKAISMENSGLHSKTNQEEVALLISGCVLSLYKLVKPAARASVTNSSSHYPWQERWAKQSYMMKAENSTSPQLEQKAWLLCMMARVTSTQINNLWYMLIAGMVRILADLVWGCGSVGGVHVCLACSKPWVQSSASHKPSKIAYALIPTLGRWRTEDQKFKFYLYIMNIVKSRYWLL